MRYMQYCIVIVPTICVSYLYSLVRSPQTTPLFTASSASAKASLLVSRISNVPLLVREEKQHVQWHHQLLW